MQRPRRRFGQNFLHDAGVIAQMIDAIDPQPGEHFLEIGPGRGALTYPLLAAGVELTAIEIDRDLAAALRQRAAAEHSALHVIEDDALNQPVATWQPAEKALRMVGNLPYNLSTPLLFHLTQAMPAANDLHVLLQREVVERMAASSGSRTYGRLSVMLQYRCLIDPVMDVPPEAFTPAPQVTSSFVRLRPRAEPPLADVDDHCLAEVVSHAFGQRRKTLRNALRPLLDAAQISGADIDPSDRAERIDLVGFGRLAKALNAVRGNA